MAHVVESNLFMGVCLFLVGAGVASTMTVNSSVSYSMMAILLLERACRDLEE